MPEPKRKEEMPKGNMEDTNSKKPATKKGEMPKGNMEAEK